MRGRFTCQMVSGGDMRKVHLQSNGSGTPSEIIINAPPDMFDNREEPQRGETYFIHITRATGKTRLP